MLKGILFDLDGTLLDTEVIQMKGWQDALKDIGVTLTKEQYIRYSGKTSDVIEKEIANDFSLSFEPGRLSRPKEDFVMDWFSSHQIDAMPYAKETIDVLSSKGLKLAVVSNGPREEMLLKLGRTGIRDSFDVVVSLDDVKRGKPHPDIYLFGLGKMGLEKDECVVIEDTEYGVRSAHSAGIKCIAIPTEFSIEQDFSKADRICANLLEARESVLGS